MLIELHGCRDSFWVVSISIFSVVVKSDVKSYYQLQDALDASLAIQALVQQGMFQYITKSLSAAGCTLDVSLAIQGLVQKGAFRHITQSSSAAGCRRCLVHPTTDDDLVICQNAHCGQVLVLPSHRLVHPAADDDFVIC